MFSVWVTHLVRFTNITHNTLAPEPSCTHTVPTQLHYKNTRRWEPQREGATETPYTHTHTRGLTHTHELTLTHTVTKDEGDPTTGSLSPVPVSGYMSRKKT